MSTDGISCTSGPEKNYTALNESPPVGFCTGVAEAAPSLQLSAIKSVSHEHNARHMAAVRPVLVPSP